MALGLFLHDEMLKENIDGEALAWAHGRLLARGEPRRILVVVSDGTPMDEATLAANGHDYLDEPPAGMVVNDIETPTRRCSWPRSASATTCRRSTPTPPRIADIEQLGPALSHKLIALLGSA